MATHLQAASVQKNALPVKRLRWFAFVGILAALTAHAHSPFESNTREIIHDTSVELALTVGMDGGKMLLQGAPPAAFQIREVGPSFALPEEFNTRFFEVASGGAVLLPDKVEVRTDGLEFNIVLEYPRPAGSTLNINAVYVNALPISYKSAFVATDEMGNIFASRVLSQENHVFETAFPGNFVAKENLPGVPATNFVSASGTAVESSVAPAGEPPPRPVISFGEFLKLGIRHILNVDAFDHLLFLTALLVGCQRLKPMLLVITGFTVAHSLTLALAALNLVTISPRIVEPAIAASIIFVAAENFRRTEKSWRRYALTCGFGLIHGFGFASSLRETGLAATGAAMFKPLLAFNLGVEIGQIAVAALVLPLLLALNCWAWFARHGARIISALVIVVAAFWLWQRLR